MFSKIKKSFLKSSRPSLPLKKEFFYLSVSPAREDTEKVPFGGMVV